MLTICGLPRPFRGIFDIIQRNSILSWTRLSPPCEIILLGDEEGTGAAAAEFGVRHLPNIARNEYGTPCLNSVLDEAQKSSTHAILCYVNSDIILMSDFLAAVRVAVARFPRFLLVGRRWDLGVKERLVFEDSWETNLRVLAKARGRLRSHAAIDYFVFPRGLWSGIPKFAIGRTAWDNWLISEAIRREVPVVDLTDAATVVHQSHPYSTLGGLAEIEKGPEGRRNLALAGGYSRLCTVWDANYRLTTGGIKRAHSPYFLYRLLVNSAARHPTMNVVLRIIRAAVAALRRPWISRIFGEFFRPDTE